ncbi:hypothetical protein [Paenibacillus sp. YYML68]|uniref:hypothetical protein n=1 Tax=Paenibacillus sp. YYML68 TaxID=2909250 RepID=UPI00249266C1|nr:hypothetical protein [Paenibacillus sp. YYML68]
MNQFELRILNQHFLTNELAEPCSHGQILLKVNTTIISDEDDGDWVINEAALSLLRTVRYGFPDPNVAPPRYYSEGIQEETLINCCGAYMLFCSSNIKWEVRLLGQVVRLARFIKDDHLDYGDLQVTLKTVDYAKIVYEFADQSLNFYNGKNVDVSGWEQFEGQYIEFWNEYKEHMEYIKAKYLM